MDNLYVVNVFQGLDHHTRAGRAADQYLEQTQAILRGLVRQQFPRERIRVVKDLTEATSELQRIVRSGDVVLFENDLPDLYVEV